MYTMRKFYRTEDPGLTFTPEYTKFFRPFQHVHTAKYQRFSFDTEVELLICQ